MILHSSSTRNTHSQKSRKYPCLLQGKDDQDIIILATGPGNNDCSFKGVVINSDDCGVEVGEYNSSWQFEDFVEYYGQVTITSEEY